MIKKSPPPVPPPTASEDGALYLIGHAQLTEYVEFVRKRAVGGRDLDKGELTGQWRAATASFKQLQTDEPGAGDKPDIQPLTPQLKAHVKKLVKLDSFQQTFATVPIAFGMVELDKLIVCQRHINLASVATLTRTLAQAHSELDIATVCLPLKPGDSDISVALEESGRLILMSDTHDARFLGARLVKPSAVKGLNVNGYPQVVLALSVGFSTNVLNVVRFGARMVLNNGYHRALALRQLGFTHAPCVIQVCAEWDDVGLAGMHEMVNNQELYFEAARPPLLKDFANPQLTQRFPTRQLRKEIRLKYDVDSTQLEL